MVEGEPSSRFSGFGSDAPFFEQGAQIHNEKRSEENDQREYIEKIITLEVDSHYPLPNFDTPSLYVWEQSLDYRMLELAAQEFVEIEVAAVLASGSVSPPPDAILDWYEQHLDELAREYYSGYLDEVMPANIPIAMPQKGSCTRSDNPDVDIQQPTSDTVPFDPKTEEDKLAVLTWAWFKYTPMSEEQKGTAAVVIRHAFRAGYNSKDGTDVDVDECIVAELVATSNKLSKRHLRLSSYFTLAYDTRRLNPDVRKLAHSAFEKGRASKGRT